MYENEFEVPAVAPSARYQVEGKLARHTWAP